jgi:hypothetical protein
VEVKLTPEQLTLIQIVVGERRTRLYEANPTQPSLLDLLSKFNSILEVLEEAQAQLRVNETPDPKLTIPRRAGRA